MVPPLNHRGYAWVLLLLMGTTGAAALDPEAAVDAWDICLNEAAKGFATKTDEPADTIASGSFGYCQREERQYREAAAGRIGSNDAEAIIRLVRVFKEDRRERLIALVMLTRIEAEQQ